MFVGESFLSQMTKSTAREFSGLSLSLCVFIHYQSYQKENSILWSMYVLAQLEMAPNRKEFSEF